MAGLTRNKITYGSFPEWPSPINSGYFYGQNSLGEAGQQYAPAFQNDSLTGSGFNILMTSGGQEAITYYNGQGTQVTDGVWASGFTPSEAWSDADQWSSLYMDSSDNKLYALVIDTGTSPNTYRMTSVDKDGTVVLETAAFQVTNTGFNEQRLSFGSTTPKLYRVGHVDGTGNFRFDNYRANTDDDDTGAPFDGCRLEINTSSGTVNGISANTMAETTDGLLPSNFYASTFTRDNMLGPTSNNIVGGPEGRWNAVQDFHTGNLLNLTTGKFAVEIPFGRNCPIMFQSSGGGYSPQHWLGNYRFFCPGSGYQMSGVAFERAAFHNFIDEMAVYYGIL
jgi:hypothetical protein